MPPSGPLNIGGQSIYVKLKLFILGTAPLWLFSLGHFFQNGNGEVVIATHFTVICLGALVVPYALGIIVQHVKRSASEAILNWLIKPLLLLVMILFITLGLYINMYTFDVLDKKTMIIAAAIPFIGFVIGGFLILVTRQGKSSAKSVAIEAANMNCLIVIVAIRFTMPQPDADMASAAAIAVLFFTPVPFICMLIFHKIKQKILDYIDNRKFEREQQETVMKSFALITQNALQISGMTPDQVNARRESSKTPNGDVTLLHSSRSGSMSTNNMSDLAQSIVMVRGDTTSVETVKLNQSNSKNYL